MTEPIRVYAPHAEPPVGTVFYSDGQPMWTRRADGWYCATPGCRRCPWGWYEVWDIGMVDTLPPGGQ